MALIVKWSDFLLMFSAECWFFGQLPPLCASTVHYGVWETTLRELAENEKLTLVHNTDGSFAFSRKSSKTPDPMLVDSEGKIFLCINLNGNTKEDPFTECWTTTGILHADKESAEREMLNAEEYAKALGGEKIAVIQSSPPTGTEVK